MEPRDYQFKELFFPHTYGFILSEDIDMQIHVSRAADTRVLHAACTCIRGASPREYDNVMCIASYGIVRFHLLVARADLASGMRDRLRILFRDRRPCYVATSSRRLPSNAMNARYKARYYNHVVRKVKSIYRF